MSQRQVQAAVYVKVAVLTPLATLFDYVWPQTLEVAPRVGFRVWIPFGRRKRAIGVVVAVAEDTALDSAQIKSVAGLLDDVSWLSEALLALLQWVAGYYHAPVGEVVFSALPPALRRGENVSLADLPEPIVPQVRPSALALHPDQQAAVHAVLATQAHAVYVLHGVTGSGKTEVYIRIIADILARGKQALVIVPEIALTPQTVSRFSTRFEAHVVVLHSALAKGARVRAWMMAASGHASIVIGTRSAVLTPMPKLGVVVLDEAHDPSFKQQSGVRYSARDVALVRAKRADVPIVLGSATPSLESLHQLARGHYQHLALPSRVGGASMPKMRLVDCRGVSLVHGLAPAVLDEISAVLASDRQVLVFLNRRGYAPAWMCEACGWVAVCTACDRPMVFHREPRRLLCHHCGAASQVPSGCGDCGSALVAPLGMGTERLAENLQRMFPDVPTLRVDRDSTRRKGSMDAMLAQVERGGAQLLLGTQMLAKGHHFPHVTLVVVLHADSGLFSMDFRATERMGQLVLQVAGRAGRAAHPGQVLLQTHHPEHPLLRVLLQQDYMAFAQGLLDERRQAGLPPFSHVAVLHAADAQSTRAMGFLQRVCAVIRPLAKSNNVQCLGPVPSPMERREYRYRYQVLLMCVERAPLHGVLAALNHCIAAMPARQQVRWHLDVDPVDLS